MAPYEAMLLTLYSCACVSLPLAAPLSVNHELRRCSISLPAIDKVLWQTSNVAVQVWTCLDC